MMPQEKIENAEIREAVERAKRNHVHRWRVTREPLEAICMIVNCEHELTLDDIECRLNATERLNAETAHAIWLKLDVLSREHMGYEFALHAYAVALEDE